MTTSVTEDDLSHLRRAIQLAQAAVEEGNHPFGSTIVAHARTDLTRHVVLVDAKNSVHTERDPTGHAETNAVRRLGSFLADPAMSFPEDEWRITLYTSTEPCAMCCGAIYWSWRIHRVVYACPEAALGAIAGDDFLIPSREIFRHGKREIEVCGPYLEEDAVALHQQYWPNLGNK